jgi:hypothetical protein
MEAQTVKAKVLILCLLMASDLIAMQENLTEIPEIEFSCPVAPDEVAESCLWDKAKKWASMGLAFWATMLTTNLAHELGHAVVGKALFTPHHVTINLPLNPLMGASVSREVAPGAANYASPLSNILMFAAGPIIGLASSYLALRLASAYQEKKQGVTYSEAWRASAQKPISHEGQNMGLRAAALLGGISYIFDLFPYKHLNNVSDGYQILEALGKSHLIGKQFMMMGVYTYWALQALALYSLNPVFSDPLGETISEPELAQ